MSFLSIEIPIKSDGILTREEQLLKKTEMGYAVRICGASELCDN